MFRNSKIIQSNVQIGNNIAQYYVKHIYSTEYISAL